MDKGHKERTEQAAFLVKFILDKLRRHIHNKKRHSYIALRRTCVNGGEGHNKQMHTFDVDITLTLISICIVRVCFTGGAQCSSAVVAECGAGMGCHRGAVG